MTLSNLIILGLVLIAFIQGIRIKKNTEDIEEMKETIESFFKDRDEKRG